MSKITETPIPSMSDRIGKLQKELEWYKAYADNVEATDHRAHEYACEHADEITGVVEYPYDEGDSYWTVEFLEDEDYDDNTGCFSNGIVAIQSCWDDQSEEMHNEDREYFDSLEEVLKYAQYQYDFIKVSCFDSGMSDIKTGDYFVAVDDDCSKFQKSY